MVIIILTIINININIIILIFISIDIEWYLFKNNIVLSTELEEDPQNTSPSKRTVFKNYSHESEDEDD